MESQVLPIISVVVPVYKAERYIERCLQSIGSQTLKGVEYIFVNDASPDGSVAAIENFFRANPLEDSAFRIINNEVNSGVGFSRQSGLDHARGKYVNHVDPDDWLEPDYLEKLYHAAESENADMTFCDIFIEYSDKTQQSKQCPKTDNGDGLITEICRGDIYASCWNKLVRHNTIEKSGARFIDGVNVCEDVLFFLQLSRNDIRIAKVHKPLYHYDRFTNANSIQRHMLPDHLAQDNRLIGEVSRILADKKYEAARGYFISSALFHIFEISSYPGAEFRRRYSEYDKYVDANDSFSYAKKKMLRYACHGGYRQSRFVYNTVSSLKNILRKLFKK